ncbi:hypothetical protein B7486_32120 [cyanobacterium TDX16]|nr:hypothetical protein B7486_32120 [cyanobacterium TDX16]
MMSKITMAQLTQTWRSQLAEDYPQASVANRESIVQWLLGDDLERFDNLTSAQLHMTQQALSFRYRILQKRYLGIPPERAYRCLISRLSSLLVLRHKVRALVALSRDRHRTVVDVIQEVLQELLLRDRYIQQQVAWIAQCTNNSQLRSTLLFASIEEYSMRPIRDRPLLVYRTINYLQRTARGGITYSPNSEQLQLVSDEFCTEESDNSFSWLDNHALVAYQEAETEAEQKAMHDAVKQELSDYLQVKLGMEAVQWFQLYLQGKSQQAIANQLNLDVRQVYRLREKVCYHAGRTFAQKKQPELVANWLKATVVEHQS